MKHGKQFNIGHWAVSAIVNADTSGLAQSEIDTISDFEKKLNGRLVMLDEKSSFMKCDISGLWDNCYAFIELIS